MCVCGSENPGTFHKYTVARVRYGLLCMYRAMDTPARVYDFSCFSLKSFFFFFLEYFIVVKNECLAGIWVEEIGIFGYSR